MIRWQAGDGFEIQTAFGPSESSLIMPGREVDRVWPKMAPEEAKVWPLLGVEESDIF